LRRRNGHLTDTNLLHEKDPGLEKQKDDAS
jgi:hypothetical protein